MTAALAGDFSGALADVAESVADRAPALDAQHTDARADIAELGRTGLFDSALHDTGLPDMVGIIDEISTHSLAVGFSAWAHTMALQYVRRAPDAVRDQHLDALRTGRRAGVTAMATGLKQVAGLGQVPLIAQPDGGGLRVTGPVPWASNLFDDALIVLPARSTSGDTFVAVVDVHAAGVTVNPPPALMALGATASTSLRLDDVHVPGAQIVSTDLYAFVSAIRPTFLLLQTAFCVGIGRAALAGAQQATGVLAAEFAAEVDHIADQVHALRERLYEFAADTARARPADLIRLRLDAAGLALRATRLESTLAGGAGYAHGNPANRRFREAAFLPVQSPSEGQLRWELSRYE